MNNLLQMIMGMGSFSGMKDKLAMLGADKVLDMMCANTITQLRTDLAEAKLEANNAQQLLT